MNLFIMAEQQLQKDKRLGKIKQFEDIDVLDKAKYIRHWLDMQERNIKVARNRYHKKGI